MDKKLPEWIKPGAWGVVGGAAAVLIVAFSAGWIVTADAATEMAKRQTDQAVLTTLTPICVAQFKTAGQAQIHVAALEAEKSWERGDYVAQNGWATMPGSTEANSAVADACADQLMKLGTQ